MSNLTLLETILIIYIIVVNVLGVVAIIMANYASNKASDTIFYILFGVAIPITLPMVLYVLTLDKWERRKRKKDKEQTIKGWTITLQKLNRSEWEFTIKSANKKENNKEITLQKTVSKKYRKLRKEYEYAIKWFQTEYRGDENEDN